jgi:hypothetical protein
LKGELLDCGIKEVALGRNAPDKYQKLGLLVRDQMNFFTGDVTTPIVHQLLRSNYKFLSGTICQGKV